jgi:hypothetical protein
MNAAYHEGGHAVRAWWLRRPLNGVSINLTRPGEGFCGVESRSRVLLAMGVPVSSTVVADDVSISLAGPLAEARYRGFRLRGLLDPSGSDDAREAWETVACWQQAKDEAIIAAEQTNCLFYLLQHETRRFLSRPKAWRAVEALARALLEHGTLAGEEAMRIIERAYGRHGIPPHWRYLPEWRPPVPLPPAVETIRRNPFAELGCGRPG